MLSKIRRARLRRQAKGGNGKVKWVDRENKVAFLPARGGGRRKSIEIQQKRSRRLELFHLR